MSILPTIFRNPARRGAVISAAGALMVIGGFFWFPLYMTALMGSPLHGETAWQMVHSIPTSYGPEYAAPSADLNHYIGTLVLPVGLLLLPLAVACVALPLSIAGLFVPLHRALIRLQQALTVLGALPFAVFLLFIIVALPWLGYWVGVSGYVCMWVGLRRQRRPAHVPTGGAS